MISFVYCVTCLLNGKRYVGKTNHPDRRWKEHCNPDPNSMGGMILPLAVIKHGAENFKFEIVAECSSEEEAFELEKNFIREWQTTDRSKGYNLNEGGRGGVNPTAEVREKIGARHRGKKISDAQKEMISKVHKGKILSEETRKKMSRSRTGAGNSRYGKPVSEETRKKMSESQRKRFMNRIP